MDEPKEPNGEERAGSNGAPPDGLTLLQRARRELRVDGNAFPHRLSRLRAQRGWSLRDMARASGVSVSAIRNVETGASGSPDPETTRALAWALGFTSAADMMGDRDAGRPKGLPVREHGRTPVAVESLVEDLLRGVWNARAGQPASVPIGPPPAAGAPPYQIIFLAVAGIMVAPEGPSGVAGHGGEPPAAAGPEAGEESVEFRGTSCGASLVDRHAARRGVRRPLAPDRRPHVQRLQDAPHHVELGGREPTRHQGLQRQLVLQHGL